MSPSNYPSSLDAFTTGTLTGIVSGSDHGNKADAINKIEAELGTDPSGSATTVKSRLEGIEVVKESPVNAGYPEYAALGAGAVQAAIDHAATASGAGITGGEVLIPRGYHTPGVPLTVTDPGITIKGEGKGVSHIVVSGNYNAIVIDDARCHVEDLTIFSTSARASGYGVFFNGASGTHLEGGGIARLDISNIFDPVFAQYIDRFALDDVTVTQSVASATQTVARFLGVLSSRVDRLVAYTTTGTFSGDGLLMDSDCDSVFIKDVEILDAVYGFRFRNSIGGASTAPRLCRVTDSSCESATAAGFYIEDARALVLNGHHSAVNTSKGYWQIGGSVVYLGCLSLQNGEHGFHIDGASVLDADLGECRASNNSQTTTNTYDGCRVENNATHVRIRGGRYGDFIYSLANKQRYGVSIGATSTNYIGLSAETDLSGNMTGGLGNFSGGANNKIATPIT